MLSVPTVERSRYFSVMLCDGNTFNYGYMGSHATGTEAGDCMVVGPDWKGQTPTGMKKVFHSSTQFSAVAYRTQLFNADDMPNVVKVQAGYKMQSLSAYLKQPASPAAPVVNFPKIDKELVKTNFFEYLDFALQFASPGPEEKDIRAILAIIGIGAGKTFDFKSLAPETKAAMGEGMKAGEGKIEEFLKTGIKNVNGWGIVSPFGDRAFYHGDWLLRAAAAKAGIYGNLAARTRRTDLPRDAPILAEDRSAVGPSRWRRLVETARDRASEIIHDENHPTKARRYESYPTPATAHLEKTRINVPVR